MCDFIWPSCRSSCLIDDVVNRKTSTLIAINVSVTTGQRRAAMFSCLMGINIALRPCYRENPGTLAPV